MATRADVAKLAGVSESTVSYVLSGKRPIGDATRRRVLDAIDQVGYKSNYAATALAGGKPRMVTMMISNLFSTPSSRIVGALVDGIVDGVRDAGFHSVIWPVTEDDDSDVDLLINSNFSGGVILMNVKENDQRVHRLHQEKIPFVVLGRTNVGFSYNFVDRDFEEVYRIALSHLKDQGHTTIGLMFTDHPVRDSLKKVAAQLKVKLVRINTPDTLEGGAQIAKDFKMSFPDVTAIVSLLDAAAIGFTNAAEGFGLAIPRDVSIIAVNMLENQAENSIPPITTVAFNAYELAKSCGSMMVEIIESDKGKKLHKTQLWVGDLIDRGSTAQFSGRKRS